MRGSCRCGEEAQQEARHISNESLVDDDAFDLAVKITDTLYLRHKLTEPTERDKTVEAVAEIIREERSRSNSVTEPLTPHLN